MSGSSTRTGFGFSTAEHLFRAVLREQGVAVTVLEGLGVKAHAAEQRLREVLDHRGTGGRNVRLRA